MRSTARTGVLYSRWKDKMINISKDFISSITGGFITWCFLGNTYIADIPRSLENKSTVQTNTPTATTLD